MPRLLFCIMSLKTTLLKLLPHLIMQSSPEPCRPLKCTATDARVFYLHRQSVIVRQNISMSELNDANRTKCPGWKNVWYFPIISKLIQKLLYNTIVLDLFISHSVIYILGGPIAFIPQLYNYVRKYVFLVQHHMYSLAINTSFDLKSPWAAVQ